MIADEELQAEVEALRHLLDTFAHRRAQERITEFKELKAVRDAADAMRPALEMKTQRTKPEEDLLAALKRAKAWPKPA